MNRYDLSVLHIARLVLEAKTALSMTSGLSEGTFDTQLVRDANGLPALPASSVAGVLRHLWLENHDETSADALFGYQKEKEGQASRLTLSWGALLDSQGRPAQGLLMDEQRQRLEDPLYQAVLAQADVPITRDRVRITHRGAASHRGKFDRAVLPAGHRFALEVRLWSQDKTDATWEELLRLFSHPLFRLGDATRAGLGAMRLIACHANSFDLKDPDQIEAFQKLTPDLTDYNGLDDLTDKLRVDHASDRFIQGTLHLEADGFWRIGEGEEPLLDKDDNNNPLKAADLLPKTEEIVTWHPTAGAERQLRLCLLPASSLKGALAHRMAFHYRCLTGQWADDLEGEPDDSRPIALDALFGAVKSSESQNEESGQVGALIIDDLWVKNGTHQVARLMHNAIDRFTGGVRDRVLFEEESLYGGSLKATIILDTQRLHKNLDLLNLEKEKEEATLRQALQLALDDLCQKRLALGSRTTSGNGFFSGELQGPLREWLEQEQASQQAAA